MIKSPTLAIGRPSIKVLDEPTAVAVDYRALNQYVEDSNLQLLESPKVDSDCECVDCNPKQVIIDEDIFNTMLEDMKHMKQRLNILERGLNNKE